MDSCPVEGDRERRLIPLFPLPGRRALSRHPSFLSTSSRRYRSRCSPTRCAATSESSGMSMIDGSAEPAPCRSSGARAARRRRGRIVERKSSRTAGSAHHHSRGLYRYRILSRGPLRLRIRSATVEIVPTRGFRDPAMERSAVTAVRKLFASLQPVMDLPPSLGRGWR